MHISWKNEADNSSLTSAHRGSGAGPCAYTLIQLAYLIQRVYSPPPNPAQLRVYIRTKTYVYSHGFAVSENVHYTISKNTHNQGILFGEKGYQENNHFIPANPLKLDVWVLKFTEYEIDVDRRIIIEFIWIWQHRNRSGNPSGDSPTVIDDCQFRKYQW